MAHLTGDMIFPLSASGGGADSASAVSIKDTGNFYTSGNVEGALQEAGQNNIYREHIDEHIETVENTSYVSNYLGVFCSLGWIRDEDYSVSRISVLASSTDIEIFFAIAEPVRVYPGSANLSVQMKKVSEIGRTFARADKVAEIVPEFHITVPAGKVIVAYTSGYSTRCLGFVRYAEGMEAPANMFYDGELSLKDVAIGELGERKILPTKHNTTDNLYPCYSFDIVTGGENIDTPLKEKLGEVIEEQSEIEETIEGLTSHIDEVNASVNKQRFDTRARSVGKYFSVIVDDLTNDALTIADKLIENGIFPAFALKMEIMNTSDLNWQTVIDLQKKGFEICFHGMDHGHTPAGSAPTKDDVMIADIKTFKKMCEEHGVYISGYAGPNHYPLPAGAFNEFEWARSAYGLDAYGAPGHLSDKFANVSVWSCDPVNGAIPSADMIAAASDVGSNQYLAPMCHTQNLVQYIDDYLAVFNAWKQAGLTCIRPMDAVRESLWDIGTIGQNSTFTIQAGTAASPYWTLCRNGNILKSSEQ